MSFSQALLVKHGTPCPYCGVIMRTHGRGGRGPRQNRPNFPTRDHVFPRSILPAQGVLIVCRKCNCDKGNQTLPQWHRALRDAGDPRAPLIAELMRKNPSYRLNDDLRPSWREPRSEAAS